MNDLSRMPKNLSAIKFGKAGFRVLPVRPNTKRPRTDNWQHEATTDRAQIEKWWEENPDYNIGLLADGYLVVDIDPARGGLASWLEMTELLEPPPTFTTKTPSGGYHLRYSLPEGVHVGNSNDTLAPGIDIKGRGGQALGPGSDINGKPYRFLTEPENGIVPLLPKKKGELPVAVYAPDWLIRLCSKPAAKKSELAGIRLNEETPEAEAAAEEWIAAAPRPPNGERNTVAYQVATRAFDFGIELSTGHHLMSQWNEEVGLEEDELRTTVESAYRNRSRPIGVDNPGVGPAGFEEVDLPSDAEINASALKEGVPAKVQLAALTPPDRKQFRLTTFKDACAMALTVTNDPLVRDVLYAGETSVTFGESGAGKSFVMLDLAFHVAAGLPWQGKPVKQGAVIWLAAEGGFGVYKRILALKEHYGAEDVPLYVLQRPVDLLHEDRKEVAGFIKLIQETQKEIGADVVLVLIDTLNRVMAGGNENGPEDMGHLLDNFDRIKFAVGPKLHLNIVHHTGLTLGRARGHTSLKAAADTEIEVSKPGRFVVKKARDEEGGFKFDYSLRKLELGSDVKGNPVTSAVVVSRVVEGNEEIAVVLNADQSKLLEAIRGKLERDGREEHSEFGSSFLLDAAMEGGLKRGYKGKWPDIRSNESWQTNVGRLRKAMSGVLKTVSGTNDRFYIDLHSNVSGDVG